MRGLEGKVAIVTGAGKGLGQAVAARLAQEGVKVVAVTRKDVEGLNNTKRMVEEQGGEILILQVDVSKEEDTLRMAQEALDRFGRIDILVNNAAVFYEIGNRPFEEIPADEWDREMSVQPKGCWLCAKAVSHQMKKQGKGKIINVASNTAFLGRPPMMHYVTSKGAVISMSYTMAEELGPHNICVNTLAPGFFLSEAGVKHRGGSKEEAIEKTQELAKTRQCIKRALFPEDLVGTVAFLASDEADMITGQTIVVDGGQVKH